MDALLGDCHTVVSGGARGVDGEAEKYAKELGLRRVSFRPTPITPSTELARSLEQRLTLVATLANPDLTLVRAAATYILYKRRRLSEASERGYRAILDDFTAAHPKAKLAEFEPPLGAHLVEDYLTANGTATSSRAPTTRPTRSSPTFQVARRPRQHRARSDRRHRAREDQAGSSADVHGWPGRADPRSEHRPTRPGRAQAAVVLRHP
jgi:hypothetical protein